jgi:hypothetical protein
LHTSVNGRICIDQSYGGKRRDELYVAAEYSDEAIAKGLLTRLIGASCSNPLQRHDRIDEVLVGFPFTPNYINITQGFVLPDNGFREMGRFPSRGITISDLQSIFSTLDKKTNDAIVWRS